MGSPLRQLESNLEMSSKDSLCRFLAMQDYSPEQLRVVFINGTKDNSIIFQGETLELTRDYNDAFMKILYLIHTLPDIKDTMENTIVSWNMEEFGMTDLQLEQEYEFVVEEIKSNFIALRSFCVQKSIQVDKILTVRSSNGTTFGTSFTTLHAFTRMITQM